MSMKIVRNRKQEETPVNEDQHPIVTFYKKYNFYITSFVIVALLAIVGLSIYQTVQNNREDTATESYDKAIMYFARLRYVTNQQTAQQIQQTAFKLLKDIADNDPQTVAGVRVRLFFGRTYFMQAFQTQNAELFKNAIKNFRLAAENSSSKFYKTIAMIGEAQTEEQINQFVQAYALYEKIYNKFPNYGFHPMVLAGMARTKEMLGQKNESKKLYEELAAKYPDSKWSMIARGKKYYLNAVGVTASPLNALPSPTSQPKLQLPPLK